MSKLRLLASAEVWDPLPQLLYCTVPGYPRQQETRVPKGRQGVAGLVSS